MLASSRSTAKQNQEIESSSLTFELRTLFEIKAKVRTDTTSRVILNAKAIFNYFPILLRISCMNKIDMVMRSIYFTELPRVR